MDEAVADGTLTCPKCKTDVTPPTTMPYVGLPKRCEACGHEADASVFLTEKGIRQLARSDPQQAARLAYSFADKARTPETAEFWSEVANSLGRR